MRACLLTAALAALCLAFAPAPFPKSGRKTDDVNSVYGKWEFVLWEMNGTKSPASQYLDLTPGKVDFVSLQGGHKVTYDFTIRPDLAPRGFHWKPGGGTGWIGSYRVEGNQLTMIFKSGASYDDRPIDFAATHEYRFILKRMR
jgi:uncharacterized protein (TIGR03067 family)